MADAASQKAPSAKKSNLGSEVGSSPKAAKKPSASAPSEINGTESHVNGNGTQNGEHESHANGNGTQNGEYEEVSPYFWSSAPRTARDFYSYNVLQPATSFINTDLPFYSKPKTGPKLRGPKLRELRRQTPKCPRQMRRKALKLFQQAVLTKTAMS